MDHIAQFRVLNPLRLHYVPGGHGGHVSDNRDREATHGNEIGKRSRP